MMKNILLLILAYALSFGAAQACNSPKPTQYWHGNKGTDHLGLVKQAVDYIYDTTTYGVRSIFNINAADHHGMTRLIRAARDGKLSLVKYLIKNHANVNIADKAGNTALIEAVRKNHYQIAKLLLAHHANVNATIKDGDIAFNLSFYDDHNIFTRYLGHIDKSFLGPEYSKGGTSLMIAVENGNLPMVKLLLAHGAHINVKDDDQETALSLAIYGHEPAITKILVDHGANIHDISYGSTMLMEAIQQINFPAVKILIQHGANVHAMDKNGNTTLILAINPPITNLPILKFLISHHVNVNQANIHGTTPLMMLMSAGNYLAVAKILIAHGANVNAADDDGDTTLMQAAMTNDIPMAKLLIAHGANIHAVAKNGDTALSIAKSKKYQQLAAILSN